MSAQFPELSDELTEARCLELINSGEVNLMLGNSHGTREEGQQQLVALSGAARIGDGDF